MKKNNIATILAWIILWILIIAIIVLTYLKYFYIENNAYITEQPINESSSNAIHLALEDIVNNLNGSENIKDYCQQNSVTIETTLNNYSIFISYITDTTTTYEFTYNDLYLNITLNKDKYDKVKFNAIYKFLIEAVQKRLNNTNNIEPIIANFLNNGENYDGLYQHVVENEIKYTMNITKKIKIEGE